MWYVLGLLLLVAVGNAFFFSMQSGDAIRIASSRAASARDAYRK
jgi:hypothetical protein